VWGVGDIHKMGCWRGGWVGGVVRVEEKRGEPGSRDEEHDNKAQNIQDSDEQ